jgi:hypothetical protein
MSTPLTGGTHCETGAWHALSSSGVVEKLVIWMTRGKAAAAPLD